VRRIQQTILLPSLCCMAFYAGTQLVGETEAAFTSRASPDSITMNAAFVFPATIHELEDRAQKVAESMRGNVKTIIPPSPGASKEELQRQLDEVSAMEEELSRQMGTLQQLYEEVSTYHSEIQKQTDIQPYDYVREGFEHVDTTLEGVQAIVDFSQIEGIRSAILMQIQELEDVEQPSVEEIQKDSEPEQSSINQTQTNPAISEPKDETSTEITNDKQVKVHEEETVEDRE
jgi:Domain of unknown function (DUF4047)